LQSGHVGLYDYLACIKVVDLPLCHACRTPKTVMHYLFSCKCFCAAQHDLCQAIVGPLSLCSTIGDPNTHATILTYIEATGRFKVPPECTMDMSQSPSPMPTAPAAPCAALPQTCDQLPTPLLSPSTPLHPLLCCDAIFHTLLIFSPSPCLFFSLYNTCAARVLLALLAQDTSPASYSSYMHTPTQHQFFPPLHVYLHPSYCASMPAATLW
ncbi:hypothetical protein BD413DRAFT_488595, partial [Trametes elegans]